MLQPLQWQQLAALAFVDGVAGVAVLIDQAVDAPGQVVFERVVGKQGERTHPEPYVMGSSNLFTR